ncbi:hypothetical protein AaE_013341 [Aphanomyces astaci]|uniref:Uncharacterized protein n=2 Tax=Aphanomyces astaci TaxID=112090 RepID=A0A6A4ZAX0_APHAT|nr:hypothetical protein AaE_013341 [Aphanomyces astaci]
MFLDSSNFLKIMVERYIDRAAADAFFQADGHEVEASIFLRGVSAYDAFQRWNDRCWYDDNDTVKHRVVSAGSSRYTVHGKERVTSVAVPGGGSANDDDRIGSVHFKLVDQGMWLEGYHAMVSFIPDRGNTFDTLVVWSVKFDPSRTSVLLCCGGTMLRMLMRNHMHRQLQRMH